MVVVRDCTKHGWARKPNQQANVGTGSLTEMMPDRSTPMEDAMGGPQQPREPRPCFMKFLAERTDRLGLSMLEKSREYLRRRGDGRHCKAKKSIDCTQKVEKNRFSKEN